MRILHVVPTYLPAVRYGGPIFAIHGLCQALAARSHEVEVFTTSVDGPGTSPVPIGIPVALDGVRVRYFPCPLLRRLYWAPALGRALQREIDTFDVVHLHSVFRWPTWAAACAARKAGAPYVLAPRGYVDLGSNRSAQPDCEIHVDPSRRAVERRARGCNPLDVATRSRGA